MSCSCSLPIRLLATKTSKLEKKDVPGKASTSANEPTGNSSTLGLFTELIAAAEETTGAESSVFVTPRALKLPVPAIDEGGTICEASPCNESKRRPVPELSAPSTGGGGGTICEPSPDSEPKRPPAPSFPAR